MIMHDIGATMSTVRKTITLTRKQDDWIKAQIERGDYTNDSEYIRDLIRREQERQDESPAEIDAIRAALIAGEQSGLSTRSIDDIWAEARTR
jgi:antitoxin ParD1/3/4